MAKQKTIEDMRLDIEDKVNMAMIEMAADMTYAIESAYESVIQSFYDDYNPRWYRRTYSTYEASNKINNPFGFSPISDGFESGIIVDSANIPGNPYRADKDWVFDRTFGQGIHGFFKWEYKQWLNQRMKTLSQKYKYSKRKKAQILAYYQSLYKNTKKPLKYRRPMETRLIMTTSADPGENFERDFSETKSIRDMGGNGSYRSKSNGMIKDMPMDTFMEQITMKGYASTPQKGMNSAFRKLTTQTAMNKNFERILQKYLT